MSAGDPRALLRHVAPQGAGALARAPSPSRPHVDGDARAAAGPEAGPGIAPAAGSNAATVAAAIRQRPAVRLSTVQMSIERLVLDGPTLSAAQQQRMLAAMAQEWQRLWRADAGLPVAGAHERVRAPALPAAAGVDPVALGIGIARSVHAGVCGASGDRGGRG